MALKVTKRQIQRQAIDAINNPPKATDKVRVSKDSQVEKQKMVHDLIPFLMMLYKKHMDAEITESQLNEGPKAGIYKGFVKISNEKVPVEVELYGVDNKKRMYLTRILHAPKKHGSILRVGNILPIPARLFTGPGGGWVRVNTKGMFETIKKVDGKYVVYPKSGGDRLGTHDTYEDALNQLQAIEASKARHESTINEIPMDDLKDVDRVADKFLNPLDVVITDKHFFDRLNDPRNGKEISQAELIGFFKRLSKHKKQFMEFLEKYEQMVAFDNRTNINIPFMKQANKAIAKTIMRKKDFKSSTPKLEI